MAALAARPESWCHGYDLMKETGLKSGTLYVLTMRMTEQGLIEAEWQELTRLDRPARHAYRLVAAGRAMTREIAQTGSADPGIGVALT